VRQEFGWFEQAGYATGLVESATEVEAPMPGVFDLMAGFLAHLTTRPPAPTTVLAFELRLLTELGLQPELGTAPLSAGSRAAARTLASVDWPGVAALRLSEGQGRELGGYLGQHLAAQWFRVPASRNEALLRSQSPAVEAGCTEMTDGEKGKNGESEPPTSLT
jgi:hypothetical protein